jgi:hypothetical protein
MIMSRWLAVLSLLVCVAPSGFAEETGREAIDKARHLFAAADHLRAAGRADLADQILKEAEELVQPVLRQLAEKRAEAARLQEEITAWERQLERPQEIAIRVRLLSLPVEQWAMFQPAAAKSRPMKPTAVDSAWLDKLTALEQDELLKKNAETTLTTRSGVAASLQNGGEIPVPVPDQNGRFAIQWREFGTRLTVLPHALGFERLQVQLSIERSMLDMEHAVMLNGTLVPGLNKQKIQTDYQSRLGETTLIYAFEVKDEVVFGLATLEKFVNKPTP